MSNHCSGLDRIGARGRVSRRVLFRLLPLLLCAIQLAGCKSGPDSWTFSVKNPFKSSDASSRPGPGNGKADAGPEFAQQLTEGRNLEKAAKYGEARRVYQKLIVAHPDRHEPYHRLGVVAERQKRYSEAQALYSQAIRREPANPQLFNDLGYCFLLQGKLEKAEAAILKAVSLSPSNDRYRINLGMVFGQMERYEEALAEFRRAGSDADAYANLAFVLMDKNRPRDARDCYRLALAADPDHELARRGLTAFEQYEDSPESRLDNGPIADRGIRWVPYAEDGESASGVQQTAMTGFADGAGHSVQPAPNSTQSSLQKSRAFLARRLRGGE